MFSSPSLLFHSNTSLYMNLAKGFKIPLFRGGRKPGKRGGLFCLLSSTRSIIAAEFLRNVVLALPGAPSAWHHYYCHLRVSINSDLQLRALWRHSRKRLSSRRLDLMSMWMSARYLPNVSISVLLADVRFHTHVHINMCSVTWKLSWNEITYIMIQSKGIHRRKTFWGTSSKIADPTCPLTPLKLFLETYWDIFVSAYFCHCEMFICPDQDKVLAIAWEHSQSRRNWQKSCCGVNIKMSQPPHPIHPLTCTTGHMVIYRPWIWAAPRTTTSCPPPSPATTPLSSVDSVVLVAPPALAAPTLRHSSLSCMLPTLTMRKTLEHCHDWSNNLLSSH